MSAFIVQAAEPADTAAEKPADKPEAGLPSFGELNEHRQETVERQEIQEFLKELVEIRQTQDGWEYGRLFDMQRLIKELGDQGGLEGAGFSEVLLRWATLQFQLRIGSIYSLEQDGATVEDYRLGQLHFSPDGKEVQAFVLFQSEYDVHWWMRLWLIKREGEWLLYDHQMLDSGKRFTTSLAELGSMSNPERESWQRAKELVDLAWTSLNYGYGDENAIQANLQAASRFPRHPETELRRQLYEFKMAVDNYAEEQAQQVLLDSLLKQERVIERQPSVLSLQAQLASNHGDHPETVRTCQAVLDYIGPDPEICRMLGTALLELDKKEKAAEAYRLGLSIEPSSFACLTGLARSLPPEKAQEVGDLFARFENPLEMFEPVAMELDSDQRPDALLAVVKAYRKMVQDDPDADYYEAKVWISKEDPARAAKLLKAAIPQVEDAEERVYFQNAYLEAMLAAGKVREVYQESEQKLSDFRMLSGLFTSSDKNDQFRELIALHQEQYPRDPWLYYYLGGLEQEEKNYEEADEVLATGMRFATEADTLDMLRMRRVLVLYQADEALEAYEKLPPRRQTFNELAIRMRDDGKTELLEKLVALHGSKDPRDPNLAVWKGEVQWQKKNYAEASRLFIAAKGGFQNSDISRTWFEERMIRSLVRADRFEEAENIALGIKQRDDNAWLLLIVYAVWQDEQGALEAAQYSMENGYYLLEEFYDDEDIGPAIRKPGFARFREKYPEPKQPSQPKERSKSAGGGVF